MKTEYTFKLPIGDWSDDGHGKCDYYHVKSNKSVEEVREIHFQMIDKLGYIVEDFACEYEDNSVPPKTMSKIIDLGFLDYIKSICPDEYLWDDYYNEYENQYTITAEGIAYLWLFSLMKTDESLSLEIIKSPEMLAFYGSDNKKRHIGFVGYGCFY